ncbi:uncharacterized protein LOC144126030 isoform X3 [Amblyomma americanum]
MHARSGKYTQQRKRDECATKGKGTSERTKTRHGAVGAHERRRQQRLRRTPPGAAQPLVRGAPGRHVGLRGPHRPPGALRLLDLPLRRRPLESSAASQGRPRRAARTRGRAGTGLHVPLRRGAGRRRQQRPLEVPLCQRDVGEGGRGGRRADASVPARGPGQPGHGHLGRPRVLQGRGGVCGCAVPAPAPRRRPGRLDALQGAPGVPAVQQAHRLPGRGRRRRRRLRVRRMWRPGQPQVSEGEALQQPAGAQHLQRQLRRGRRAPRRDREAAGRGRGGVQRAHSASHPEIGQLRRRARGVRQQRSVHAQAPADRARAAPVRDTAPQPGLLGTRATGHAQPAAAEQQVSTHHKFPELEHLQRVFFGGCLSRCADGGQLLLHAHDDHRFRPAAHAVRERHRPPRRPAHRPRPEQRQVPRGRAPPLHEQLHVVLGREQLRCAGQHSAAAVAQHVPLLGLLFVRRGGPRAAAGHHELPHGPRAPVTTHLAQRCHGGRHRAEHLQRRRPAGHTGGEGACALLGPGVPTHGHRVQPGGHGGQAGAAHPGHQGGELPEHARAAAQRRARDARQPAGRRTPRAAPVAALLLRVRRPRAGRPRSLPAAHLHLEALRVRAPSSAAWETSQPDARSAQRRG